MIRTLKPGDESILEAFLVEHAASSMFLRANVRRAGLVDRGERFHGTYAASIVDEKITAVAGHAWNGMMLVQAPVDLPDVVRCAARASLREVRGFAGPWEQVVAARVALSLNAQRAALESTEDLFELELHALSAPAAARSVRRATEADLEILTVWRHDYMVETLHADAGEALLSAARAEMVRAIEEGTGYVLEHEGALTAYSGFNAQLPDVVQVGGVFTPKPLRGRGFARATVAGSLLDARERGASRAILFTDRHNVAARAAYLALGFRVIGDYGLIMF